MQLYLDMDGVLMDFESAIHAHGVERYKDGAHWIAQPRAEWPPEMVAADAAYVEVMAKSNFWDSIRPMSDAHLLWDACRTLSPHILTAAPTDRPPETRFSVIKDRIAQQKRESIWQHFDPTFPAANINVCLRHEKKYFANNVQGTAPAILIDDTPGNCREWTEAGGIAILHRDAVSTIRILREILHD